MRHQSSLFSLYIPFWPFGAASVFAATCTNSVCGGWISSRNATDAEHKCLVPRRENDVPGKWPSFICFGWTPASLCGHLLYNLVK